MIKNLIFDFGDIFINLDKTGAMNNALALFKCSELSTEMIETNMAYEKGLISTNDFINFYSTAYPNLSKQQIIDAWNYILLDFPIHRLEFLEDICTKYRCFLLSNTNELHINWIKEQWKTPLYNRFKKCFEQFYLSHEIHMRKPDAEIYTFVLTANNLNPEDTIFIDDLSENTKAAQKLGIHTWNLIPESQDVTNLTSINNTLF